MCCSCDGHLSLFGRTRRGTDCGTTRTPCLGNLHTFSSPCVTTSVSPWSCLVSPQSLSVRSNLCDSHPTCVDLLFRYGQAKGWEEARGRHPGGRTQEGEREQREPHAARGARPMAGAAGRGDGYPDYHYWGLRDRRTPIRARRPRHRRHGPGVGTGG